ncbi:DUF29 family protein [Rippkaea orientalis]|uniref:DUF29 family protein n=1 Tax=Rippkaea orientalis TaxID=2546366 RepID=UPI0002DBA280|nr:DUF29 family protein [Rippkaea orientalis]
MLTLQSYDFVYYLWLQITIEQLRNGHFSTLDRENLIEELESTGIAISQRYSHIYLNFC